MKLTDPARVCDRPIRGVKVFFVREWIAVRWNAGSLVYCRVCDFLHC